MGAADPNGQYPPAKQATHEAILKPDGRLLKYPAGQGVGTVLFAFGMGPMVKFGLHRLGYQPHVTVHTAV